MRFVRVLVPLALAGTLLAGCGGDTSKGNDSGDAPATTAPADNGVAALEPDAILSKAKAELDNAKSFSLKGDITSDKTKIGFDVKVSGKDVLGTITLSEGTIELLRVGNEMYVRPDEKFWKASGGAESGGAAAELIGNRWARLSSKNTEFGVFFQLADPDKLLEPDGKITKGDTKTINGVKAIGLVEEKSKDGTLYIATTGKPYPLALEGPAGEGQIAFGDFGATFNDIKAPAESEVIELDKLMNK